MSGDDATLGPRADDRYRVDTPERIDLEYDVAGLGSRFLAALIDTTILSVAAALVAVLSSLGLAFGLGALAGLLDSSAIRDVASSVVGAGALLLTVGVLWGYYVFFELVWHGRTPGKRWIGLRVIKDGGYPVGFVDSAIRNVVRVVDFLPAYYIAGMLTMLVDRRSRRLGDLAAGTLVVKERRDLSLETLMPDAAALLASAPREATARRDGERPPIANLDRLAVADASLVREYLLRRASLSKPGAEALAARLAEALAERLEHDLAGEDPDAFLARLSRQIGEGRLRHVDVSARRRL